MIPAQIMTGAVAGVAASKADAATSKSYLDEHAPDIHHDIHTISDLLQQIEEHLRAGVCRKRDKQETLVLQPGIMLPLSTYERAYTLMFAPVTVLVKFDVPGVGITYLTLVPGWNVLNLPDGTWAGLDISATTSVSVLYRATDVLFGGVNG